MSKKTILLLFVFFCCLFTANTSADVSYTNDIELFGDSIVFTVKDMYTDEDALAFRQDLDTDEDGYVDASELEAFRQNYMSNGGSQFLEYVLVDEGSIQLAIASFDMQFQGAQGPVDTSDLMVITTIQYNLGTPINKGEHSVWVLGHPLIDSMRFILPPGMEMISYDGLDEASYSVKNGRVVIEGVSGIRSFMAEETTTLEYAALIQMQKEPFYKKSFFLPLLLFIELVLASIALYIIKRNKNK